MIAQVGKTYAEIGGQRMLVLRDVPANEVGLRLDPAYEYVEVVFADNPTMSNGWRRKHDGKYATLPYVNWPRHPNHLVIDEEQV